MLPRSGAPLEVWLSALAHDHTPYGVATDVERVGEGAVVRVWRPKEPIPYFVHARVEFAGREPEMVDAGARTGLIIRERYRFGCPSILHVYYWVEERFAPAAATEPAAPLARNVTYLCATPEQLARAAEVMAQLSGPASARRRALEGG